MQPYEINHEWYSSTHAVELYAADDRLEPPLVLILLKYRDHLWNQPVLDIGVGAGRTTLYLSRCTPHYVGIDYSERMVAHCRGRFPSVRTELCDVRDLRRFGDASFRLALFSYNGIGAIDHESRLRALAEIARVLQPGGIFAFSAHNRGYAHARDGPHLEWSRNPITAAANVVRWLERLGNHARIRRLEYEGSEYALVNDLGEDFMLLHYYLTKEEQRRQLEHAGLELVEMYDRWTNPVSEGDDVRSSPWIWYVARKPGQ